MTKINSEVIRDPQKVVVLMEEVIAGISAYPNEPVEKGTVASSYGINTVLGILMHYPVYKPQSAELTGITNVSFETAQYLLHSLHAQGIIQVFNANSEYADMASSPVRIQKLSYAEMHEAMRKMDPLLLVHYLVRHPDEMHMEGYTIKELSDILGRTPEQVLEKAKELQDSLENFMLSGEDENAIAYYAPENRWGAQPLCPSATSQVQDRV